MTPLEQGILDEFAEQLRNHQIDETITATILDAFSSDKQPSADALAVLIRENSGVESA